jgi:hypothetical protein
MKGLIVLFLALSVQLFTGHAASTNSPSADGVLLIERSLLRTSGAKAVLTVGPLCRAAGTFAGDYQVKVSPYFFKSEKGKLAIVVSAESLLKLKKGIPAEIAGTATTDGERGSPRPVYATVTPSDADHGALKVWFNSGDKKLIFDTSYRFVQKPSNSPSAVLASSSN